MKSRSTTNKASLEGMAPGRALLVLFAVNLITSGFVLTANANKRKTSIITFDAPGASNGTLAIAINPQGTITGVYADSVAGHGYVRARDGSFTTFDVPGAGPDKGQCESINPAGTITGIYNTGLYPNLVVHGFVRATDGAITTIDVPGAGTGSFQGTYALTLMIGLYGIAFWLPTIIKSFGVKSYNKEIKGNGALDRPESVGFVKKCQFMELLSVFWPGFP